MKNNYLIFSKVKIKKINKKYIKINNKKENKKK